MSPLDVLLWALTALAVLVVIAIVVVVVLVVWAVAVGVGRMRADETAETAIFKGRAEK